MDLVAFRAVCRSEPVAHKGRGVTKLENPQYLPHLTRHRGSLVDLRVISGSLLHMESRFAYLDCRPDIHPILILSGRLVIQPRRELVV
jgi:hypothetical protein